MEKRLLIALLSLLLTFAAAGAHAGVEPLIDNVQQLVRDQVQTASRSADAAAPPLRVEVLVGKLDERLRLAPCEKIEPYLPKNARVWGKTRVGLKCVKGVTPWNVYLPVTVNVYGPALVATHPLPAGHELVAGDVRLSEVNLAEDPNNPPLMNASTLIGRTLAKALEPGQGLRQSSLRSRQWFAAGERVLIKATGKGFHVAGEGEAITAGLEGQPARVRVESGRIVQGQAVGERQLELAL